MIRVLTSFPVLGSEIGGKQNFRVNPMIQNGTGYFGNVRQIIKLTGADVSDAKM
jgi:hypothetical protein